MMPSMHRSERVVGTLMEVDPDFQLLAEILYGAEADAQDICADVFEKRAPQLSPEDKRRATEQRIAQVSNVVGLAAGTAGTASATSAYRMARRNAKGLPPKEPKPKGRLVQRFDSTRAGKFMGSKRGIATLAGAGLALQAGNVAGDAITARVLGRKPVKKYYLEVHKNVVDGAVKAQAGGIYNSMLRMLKPTGKHVALPKPAGAQKPSAGANGGARSGAAGQWVGNLRDKPVQTMTKTPVGAGILGGTAVYGGTRPGKAKAKSAGFQEGYYAKADETKINKPVPSLELAGTFSKFDDAKKQAFGFASVVKKDGLPVIDRQGDYIDLDEMEKAAYHYVQKSRVGGDMHKRQADEYGIDRAHHVSDLIESMVFTNEKCKAMGLPEEVIKQLEGHWWVGYQIHDEATWQEVRKKGRTGFSIHGRGKRVDTTIDELV